VHPCMSLHQIHFPRALGVVVSQLDRTIAAQGNVIVHALLEVP
jgi:hypothetical protein